MRRTKPKAAANPEASRSEDRQPPTRQHPLFGTLLATAMDGGARLTYIHESYGTSGVSLAAGGFHRLGRTYLAVDLKARYTPSCSPMRSTCCRFSDAELLRFRSSLAVRRRLHLSGPRHNPKARRETWGPSSHRS